MKKLFVIIGISAAIFACNSADDQKATDEKKADTAAAAETAPAPSSDRGLELIAASDCTTCHDIETKKIGPAYRDVAAKYEATPAVIDTLVSKVIKGGVGVWGTIPMTAHATLPEADAREMVLYILSLKK